MSATAALTPIGHVVLAYDRRGRLQLADRQVYIGELEAQYVAQDLSADTGLEHFVCSLRPVLFPDPEWLELYT